MPQTVFGQSDALALALVALIGAKAGTLVLPVTAERRFSRKDDLPDIPTFADPVSIDVFPDVEVTERFGMHSFTSQYAVHLYIQQQVSGALDPEAQCALLCQLRSQIIEGLKAYGPLPVTNAVVAFPGAGAVLVHAKSADKGLYDLGRLESEHVFESDTILLFKAAG
jgi:hypothetical protein